MSRSHPALADHLYAWVYPDGQPRETGSMLLFYESGLFKAAVMDRDAGMTAFVSAETLTGLLDAVDKGLHADKLDWRASRSRPRR